MLAPVRTAAPAALVTVEEARRHLRVDTTEDDDVITALIASATQYLDGYSGVLGRALVTQTWRQEFCGFAGRMALPLGPATSITSSSYFDAANATAALDAAVFGLFADARGPYVGLKPDQVWPSSYSRPDAVSITYVVGQDAAEVSATIKTTVLLMVAHWYEHREAVSPDAMTELPLGVQALIAPYRRVGV